MHTNKLVNKPTPDSITIYFYYYCSFLLKTPKLKFKIVLITHKLFINIRLSNANKYLQFAKKKLWHGILFNIGD